MANRVSFLLLILPLDKTGAAIAMRARYALPDGNIIFQSKIQETAEVTHQIVLKVSKRSSMNLAKSSAIYALKCRG